MKIKKLACAGLADGALLLGGMGATSTAQAAPVQTQATTQEEWVHIGDYFYETDCVKAGTDLKAAGAAEFNCDGSWSPFDEYSLFVKW